MSRPWGQAERQQAAEAVAKAVLPGRVCQRRDLQYGGMFTPPHARFRLGLSAQSLAQVFFRPLPSYLADLYEQQLFGTADVVRYSAHFWALDMNPYLADLVVSVDTGVDVTTISTNVRALVVLANALLVLRNEVAHFDLDHALEKGGGVLVDPGEKLHLIETLSAPGTIRLYVVLMTWFSAMSKSVLSVLPRWIRKSCGLWLTRHQLTGDCPLPIFDLLDEFEDSISGNAQLLTTLQDMTNMLTDNSPFGSYYRTTQGGAWMYDSYYENSGTMTLPDIDPFIRRATPDVLGPTPVDQTYTRSVVQSMLQSITQKSSDKTAPLPVAPECTGRAIGIWLGRCSGLSISGSRLQTGLPVLPLAVTSQEPAAIRVGWSWVKP